MRDFADLYAALDATTRTNEKVAALADYFRTAPEQDRLWTIALFSGRRPKRVVAGPRLRDWAAEAAGLPLWLMEESHASAGDLSETIALVLPPPARALDLPLSDWIARLQAMAALPDTEKKPAILEAWDSLPAQERFLLNKLLSGSFRVGVSQTLMTRALAQATGLAEQDVAHRLMGDWTPDRTSWAALLHSNDPRNEGARPYPFYLAYPLDDPALAADPAEWFAERKWDGIRGQLILRGGAHHLWSRGEELVTDRYPELARAIDWLPQGTVLDGEIMAWRDGPLPFAALQTRIGRKTLTKAVLDKAPVILMAYDLLEQDGKDIRPLPFADRRARLASLMAGLPPDAPLRLSPEVPFATLDDLASARAASREHAAEGLMLKRRSSPYGTGRRKGDWWKWKVDPFSVDAVMVYAQAGSGRRANLFTDFTFAVRDGDALVPFAKAYSGLTDEEFRQITAWVNRHTTQRFGPVRQVEPVQVFEIGFEGIQASPRHKSGVALRFPRMLRWRRDKPAAEIDTLDTLRALLAEQG
jgi:DNA ligase-1